MLSAEHPPDRRIPKRFEVWVGRNSASSFRPRCKGIWTLDEITVTLSVERLGCGFVLC